MAQNHYQTLGISSSATAAQVKTAYREMSRLYHPDRNPSPEAKEIYEKVREAYNILSDPELKRVYDNLSAAEFEKWNYSRLNPQPSQSSWFWNRSAPPPQNESAELTINFEGRVFNLSASLLDKIINTKCTLSIKTNVPVNDIRLFYRGVELKDDQKIHKYYKITNSATLDAFRNSRQNNVHSSNSYPNNYSQSNSYRYSR